MDEGLGTESRRKVIWAARFKFYGGVFFILAMLILVFGMVETQSGRNLFAIFAIPGVSLLTFLFFIRCSNCGSSLYFRKGYSILTFGIKWVPVWMLVMPTQCKFAD